MQALNALAEPQAKFDDIEAIVIMSDERKQNMDCNTGLAWLGFWIFAAVFVACDHWIYSKGHNSFLQSHKTEAEKELQRLEIEHKKLNIDKLRRDAEHDS